MKRRNASAIAGLIGLSALSLASCEAEPKGQIILALQTDMSLPKDIDRIRLSVSYADTNGILFQKDYDRVGTPESLEPIRLPATLSIVASEKENRPIRVKVLAARGLFASGTDPLVRVVRDSVTTVPTDRIVKLPVPIEFLCDGTAKPKTDAATGKPVRDPFTNELVFESTCGEGLTCKAGKCVAEEVKSDELPDYDDSDVFGGGSGAGDGTCFDTSGCFEDPTELALDMAAFDADNSKCKAAAAMGAWNVGIETQGSGMCNAKGCYVALDADSESGWMMAQDGQSILLPTAVCEKYKAGEIARVVGTPVGNVPCAQKRSSVPTCGPWSSAGNGLGASLDPNAPQLLINGQTNPSALVVHATGLYFSTQGNLVTNDPPGSVKIAPISGGAPDEVAITKGVPQGLVIDPRGFVVWTDATGAADGTVGFAPLGPQSGPQGAELMGGLLQPAGVAVSGNSVYLTELGGDRLSKVQADLDPASNTLVKGTVTDVTPAIPLGVAPWSVVAAEEAVCFGFQGTQGNADGAVGCSTGMALVTVASNLKTPRSLLFEKKQADGSLAALYFVELDMAGTIQRVPFANGTFGAPQVIGGPISRPSGLALDLASTGAVLYYTSLDEGSVNAINLADTKVYTVVEKQKNPSAVAVDADFVYWVESGTANTKEGAIYRAPKPVK